MATGEYEISLLKIRDGFPPKIKLLTIDRPGDEYPMVFSLPGITELTLEMVKATRTAYDVFDNYAERVSWGPKEKQIYQSLIVPTLEQMKGMRFVDEQGQTRSARVLHAGCGTGRELKFLTDFGFQGIGIDISLPMISRGRKQWEKDQRWRQVSAPFAQMDMTELGVAAGYFDLVLSESGLRHIPTREVPVVISAFHRSLRPGGLCLAAFREGSGEIIATVDKVDGKIATRYSTTCQFDEALGLVQNAGFSVERTIRNPHMDTAYGVPDWLVVMGRKSG